MSRPAAYFTQHRRKLILAGVCRFGANHGPTVPMTSYCAVCQQKQAARNRRNNPRRPRRKIGQT